MNTPLPRLLTDFNSADEDEAVVLVEDAQLVPEARAWVRLVDVDGNNCEGIVTSVAEGLIYVKPLWSTWREADTVDERIVDLMESLRAAIQQAQADRAKKSDRDGNEAPTKGRARILDDVA